MNRHYRIYASIDNIQAVKSGKENVINLYPLWSRNQFEGDQEVQSDVDVIRAVFRQLPPVHAYGKGFWLNEN